MQKAIIGGKEKPSRPTLRQKKQQLGGAYASVLVALMFGTIVFTALKLIPSYIENKTIVNTIISIDEKDGLDNLSLSEVRQSLSRILNTNGIRDFSTDNVILTKVGSKSYFDLIYEKRISIALNIEAVLMFNERFEK